MMKGIPVVSAILLLCSACSSVWQEQGEITPATYDVRHWRIERSVGRLRRLGLVPPRFSENFFIMTAKFWQSSDEKEQQLEAIETRIENALLRTATAQLADRKGYDVVVLREHKDMLKTNLELSNEEYTESLKTLADWAEKSADGEAPPERIVNLVQQIGGALELDGLVVIQGFHRHPNITSGLILVPFYGVFALPLIPLEDRSQLTADIYEVTSGRIVWRSSITGGPGNSQVNRLLDRSDRLFAQLEYAMPAVLLGEQ